MAGLLSRAVVVLDKANKVVYTEQVPEIAQEPNYKAALEAARLLTKEANAAATDKAPPKL